MALPSIINITDCSGELHEILTHTNPLFDVASLDLDRIRSIWSCITGKVHKNYGVESALEDIHYHFSRDPFFVCYVISEHMSPHERSVSGFTNWNEFVKKSFEVSITEKFAEISECIKHFETIRQFVSDTITEPLVVQERIYQNSVFKKYIKSRLWLSLYRIYSNLSCDTHVTLQHLKVPLNPIEIRKFEFIWKRLQKKELVPNIPPEFWEWIPTDTLRKFVSSLSPSETLEPETPKESLANRVCSFAILPFTETDYLKTIDENIRRVNAPLVQEFTTKILTESPVFDSVHQILKVFSSNECKDLICTLTRQSRFEFDKLHAHSSHEETARHLFFTLYSINYRKFLQNRVAFIQKKMLENVLCGSNLLDFGFINSPQINIPESKIPETTRDFYPPSDISHKWFLNAFRSFCTTESEFELFWKFRCSNFNVRSFHNFVYKITSFDEIVRAKLPSSDFTQNTQRDVSLLLFYSNDIPLISLKVKHWEKTRCRYPPTYSFLLRLLADNSYKTPRALEIMAMIIQESIAIDSIVYKFTPSSSVINDDEISEI